MRCCSTGCRSKSCSRQAAQTSAESCGYEVPRDVRQVLGTSILSSAVTSHAAPMTTQQHLLYTTTIIIIIRNKILIKMLQGSVVTQTALGGLTIYLLVANFLQYVRAKNYENWLAVVITVRLAPIQYVAPQRDISVDQAVLKLKLPWGLPDQCTFSHSPVCAFHLK